MRDRGDDTSGALRRMRYRWKNIVQWCLNPAHFYYSIYGGAGVTVSVRWVASFDAFLADVGEPSASSLVLARVDKARGFHPGNVQWVTRREEARSRRPTRLVEFRGEVHPLAEWGRRLRFAEGTLCARLALGWSIERAFTTPVDRTCRPDLYDVSDVDFMNIPKPARIAPRFVEQDGNRDSKPRERVHGVRS